MPAKSAKQEKFLQAVAHNKAFAKKVGVPQSVGKEFTMKKKMMKKAGGGLMAGHKAADGIAKKGKTKGKKVVMAKGGYAKGGMKGC